MCMGWGVLTTCGQRVMGMDKTSVQEPMLGVGFIGSIKQSGTYGDLDRTQRQQMECYVEAQCARS